MGKESKRRKLRKEAEERGTGIVRKEGKTEGLMTGVLARSQGKEDEVEEEETGVERAIEDMLTECYQKAFEGEEAPCDYDLGGEFGSRKDKPSPPGQGRKMAATSQLEVRSKQSAGMDRRQRQAWSEEELEKCIGEVSRSSQPAWDHSPRLDLRPCHGEELMTEHDPPASWPMSLRCVCGEKESSLRELSPALSKSLEVLSQTTRCGQSTEGIFPLPLPGVLGWCEQVDSVLDALVRGLNSLYGVTSAAKSRVSKVQKKILVRLREVVRSSALPDVVLPPITFQKFFATRGIDYSGEEVRVAKSFQWKMVAAAFPEGVGSLDLEAFCEGGTRSYVTDFEQFLIPPQDQSLGKTPSIMVNQEHWAEVCRGLIERGVCSVMKKEDLYHVNGRPVLNGLFAVEKGEKAVDDKGEEFEVCRLIMNLVPTNGLCRNLVGDTSTLPTVTGMSGTVLGDGELLLTSSEDVRCFFYLFRTPHTGTVTWGLEGRSQQRASQKGTLVVAGIL